MSSDHKLVPIEPTAKMIGAALDADDTCWNDGTPDWYAEKLFRAVWAAMIYAADPSETLAGEELALGETSGSTRWAVERAKGMLSAGINIQAVGDSTNSVVTGIIKSLLDHIDELDADLKCAIAVGRLAARSSQLAEGEEHVERGEVDAALGSVNADAPAPFSEASQNYAERDPSVMAD